MGMRRDRHRRVAETQRIFSRLYLQPADVGLGEQKLTGQIGRFYVIGIDQDQAPDARGGKLHGDIGPDTTYADDGHGGGRQLG